MPSKNSAIPGRKNTVSAPRSKASKELKPTSLRLSPADHKEFKAIAKARHVSLAYLIVEALKRCREDNIWQTGVLQNTHGTISVVPPPELVELSNTLLAFSLVIEQILPKTRNVRVQKHAEKIYCDARKSLESARQALGC